MSASPDKPLSIEQGKAVPRPKSSHVRVAIPLPLSKPKTKQAANITESKSTNEHLNGVEEHGTGKATGSDNGAQAGAESSTDESRTPLDQSNNAVIAGTATPDSVLSEQLTAHNGDSAPSNSGSTNPSTPSQGEPNPRKPQQGAANTHQKPAPLRTELPPAFVPSDAVVSPHVPTSPWHSARSSQVINTNQYELGRPTANSISQPSAAGQPSYPSSPAEQTHSRAYNNRHSKHRSSISFQQGHSHNISDTNARFPPSHYHPAHQPWQQNLSSHPTNFHHYNNSNSSNRFAAYNPVSPTHVSNGQTFPLHPDTLPNSFVSYDPRPRFNGHRASFDTNVPPNGQAYFHQIPSGPTQSTAHGTSSTLLVGQHVSSFLSSTDFADIDLHVHTTDSSEFDVRRAHRLVLAQSPRLLEMIKKLSMDDASRSSEIKVHLSSRWMSLQGFDSVLSWLYGRDLAIDRKHDSTNDDHDDRPRRLQHVLSAIAVSQYLQLDAAANRGVSMFAPLLSWDTVLTALHFALDGGLHHSWNAPGLNNDVEGSRRVDNIPTNDPAATELVKMILHFLAHNFPPNFYSDASASHLTFLPRLPASDPTPATTNGDADANVTSSISHRSTRSLNDPRLSRIRFGEVNEPTVVNGNARPSPTTTTLSSILFSLPFPLLKFLLEHPALSDRLGIDTVGSIMRQVVAERETRRVKVLETSSNTGTRSDEARDAAIDNLHWEELVELSSFTPLGIQLARRKNDVER